MNKESRIKVCKLILIIIIKNKYFPNKNRAELNNIAKEIERGIFRYTEKEIKESNIYGNVKDQKTLIYEIKARNLLWYLSNEVDNPSIDLIKKLKEKNIDFTTIAFMKPDEINEKLYEKDKQNIIKRLKVKIKKNYNKLYRCNRCKEYKVITVNHQRRALDEAAGLQCICDGCGHRWNIG